VLELRPTTFGTPPLSKGWGHQPSTTDGHIDKINLTRETRLVSILISLYCTLFNKLLVHPICDYQFWSFDTSEHWSIRAGPTPEKGKNQHQSQQRDDGQKFLQLKTSPEPSSATTEKSLHNRSHHQSPAARRR
jgi:hypothetical protein